MVETLNEVCRRIADFNRVTDENFLSIGTKIQEYSEKITSIAKKASAAAEIMSGDEIRGAINGLKEMAGNLEGIFLRVDNFSDNNLKTLRSIELSVRSVVKEMLGLDNTSKDLKMLALSTKIQSTKTGEGVSAFMQLGQDISKMSMIISSKAKDLLNETATLSDFLRSVEANLHDLKDKQNFQTKNVLEGTRRIIESMVELNRKSNEEGVRIRESSEEISRSVSDLVTFVQYQDITRQSLDKIVNNLNMILDRSWSGGSGDEDPATPWSGLSPEIITTGVCLMQALSLKRTNTIIQGAFEKMLINLEGITSNIEGMASVTSVASNDSTRFLEDLEGTMSTVTSFLREVVQSSREMSKSMNSLAHTVENMSEFTEDIEMISSEVELISFNALIMAAQTGVDGAGMGVIAEAVQETAMDSEDQRKSIVGRLNDISRSSQDLKGEMENATQSEENKLDQLVRELGVFLDSLRIMQERIVSTLRDIDDRTAELVSSLNVSIENLKDYVRQDTDSANIISEMKILALSSSSSIAPEDLLSITGNRFTVEELQSLDNHQRMELTEEYFREHYLEEISEGAHTASANDLDVVFFEED